MRFGVGRGDAGSDGGWSPRSVEREQGGYFVGNTGRQTPAVAARQLAVLTPERHRGGGSLLPGGMVGALLVLRAGPGVELASERIPLAFGQCGSTRLPPGQSSLSLAHL